MKKKNSVMWLFIFALVAGILGSPQASRAHCQIPCGIYDDHARVHAMLEDVTTIEKSLVLIGNGEVTPERCLTCHYEIERFDDTQYQHDVHINWNTDFTKPKVECGSCHGEIQHGGFES